MKNKKLFSTVNSRPLKIIFNGQYQSAENKTLYSAIWPALATEN
jgi:hypothetical protein